MSQEFPFGVPGGWGAPQQPGNFNPSDFPSLGGVPQQEFPEGYNPQDDPADSAWIQPQFNAGLAPGLLNFFAIMAQF